MPARTGEDDLLLGLAGGADDHLAKPCSPRELVARVRTVLRRAAPVAPGLHRVGGLVVDVARHEGMIRRFVRNVMTNPHNQRSC
ncbi:hypothetical protein AB0H12_08660 [Actinosynnema sp. NPDC023794]